MLKEEFEKRVVSAQKFRDKNGYYVFPFEALDKTPGGKNLGRIEWHIEPIHGKKKGGRYYIESLYVWATQTYDKRYKGKVFKIECYSGCITGYSLPRPERSSFLSKIWRVMVCELHKTPVFSAYPEDKHKRLWINVGSSIAIDADFES